MATGFLHPRTIVRTAAVAWLTGKTVAADRIRASRRSPFRGVDLPAIVAYTPDDTITEDSKTTAPTNLERHITLVIEAAVAVTEFATTKADDAADALAREIEVLLEQAAWLDGITNDVIGLKPSYAALQHTKLELLEEGEQPVAFAVLTYRVCVFDRMLDANADLDDFKTANVTYDLGGAQAPAEESIDIVTLPIT